MESLREEGWSLDEPDVRNLLDKMREAGVPLGQIVQGRFCYGIKTGFNEAFVIHDAKRAQLVAQDAKSSEIIKPFLRGRDVKRWNVQWASLYLIKTEIGVNIRRYPAIFDHLSQYKDALERRCDKGDHWWELRTCDYYGEFEKPKIVYPNIFRRATFAYDDKGFLSNQKTFIIPVDDLALLAVLNSSLIDFWCKHSLAKLQNDYLEPSTIFLQNCPIASVPRQEKDKLEQLARRVMGSSSRLEIEAAEREIDQIVYRTYGMTREEIAVVERR